MVLFRPSNVYEESWLLIGVTRILGLYPIKLFRSTCTNYISVIILIICYLTLQLHLRQYANSIFDDFLAINETFIIRKVRYYLNIFVLPIITISSIRQSAKIRETLEQMDAIDKNIQFFNVKIDHTFCMKNDIFSMTTVAFIVIMSNLMDYYGLLDNDRNYMYVLMWIADRIPDFISTIIICSFGLLISKIKFRFRQINKILMTIKPGKSLVPISATSDMNNNTT